MEFRDKYKDELEAGITRNYEFNDDFNRILREAELRSKLESKAPTKMRTFEESKKSQKTVASLKIDKNEKNKESSKNAKKGGSKNKKQEVMEEGNYYCENFYGRAGVVSGCSEGTGQNKFVQRGPTLSGIGGVIRHT